MSSRLSDFSLQRSWVTIGSFDGVHLGHQYLVRKLVDGAHAAGSQAVIITFNPHPAVFFKRVSASNLLSSPEERESLLCTLGVDKVITLSFDASVANLTAEQFVQMMKEYLGIEHLQAGADFALGKNRTGTMLELARLGTPLGIEVEIVPPFVMDGKVVSSSLIRLLLQSEQVKEANTMLGRPYALTGEVVHGEARGSRLGFPTANMQIPAERLLPANGIYATRAIIDGESYPSVTNIGIRPTFDHPLSAPRVEPYLMNVDGDFYGKRLTLEFIEFLRPEIKFPDAASLIRQINRDVEKAREVLAHDA